MISTITAITRSRWIRDPPTCPRRPRSQRTSRIMIIVQSIGLSALLIEACDKVTRIRTHPSVSPAKKSPIHGDARRRKQYRYHERWREIRDENKFARLADF